MSRHFVAGFAAEALHSLNPSQIAFIKRLPKAELHAHLNGSIPLSILRELLTLEHTDNGGTSPISAMAQAGLERLQDGVELREIHDFFELFPAIYALTSTPAALGHATRGVLREFLDGGGDPGPDSNSDPQCAYLELRTTPRETPTMTRLGYMCAVLDEVEKYPPSKAAVIVSLDRRMKDAVVRECVEIASRLRTEGRRVVGVDLCGDPTAGDVDMFVRHLKKAKKAGLGVTLHIAETRANTPEETLQLLSCQPDRLGHATFLNDEVKELVLKNKTCIEICLSSNLLCKTVATLDDHHIRYYLQNNHPIAICTDDILPFRNSMLGEYALLMAQPPLGLGLTEEEVSRVAKMSMECRFRAA